MTTLRHGLCFAALWLAGALLHGCTDGPVLSTRDAGHDGGRQDAGLVEDSGIADTGVEDAGAGGPVTNRGCTWDPGTRVLSCREWTDPEPDAVDDEYEVRFRLQLAPGADDGTARAIDAETDMLGYCLCGAGLDPTADRTPLNARSGHDPAVEDVLGAVGVHLYMDGVPHGQARLEGTVTVRGDGTGALTIAVREPTSWSYDGFVDATDYVFTF